MREKEQLELFNSAPEEKRTAPAKIECGSYYYLECMSREEWLESRKAFPVPASEVPMIMGDFKSKSAVRLMAEKRGLYNPQDLSGDENIQRGREREAIIRRAFAERHPELKVTHHPYRIYVNTRRPWMSCTLDAEIQDGDWWGTLEIKSVGYRSRKELEAFMAADAPAVKFYEQTLAQKAVTDADVSYIVVELAYIGDKEKQGDLPDYYEKEFVFGSDPDVQHDMWTVIKACEEFKDNLEKGKLPDVKMEAESGEVVVLKADVEVGKFYENFEQMKGAIEAMVEPYKGVVFTEETAKDASSVHAELNSMSKAIDEKRILIKKKYLEPYNAFEAKANELKKIIEQVRVPIKEQIDLFEVKRKEEKELHVKALLDEVINEKIEEADVKDFFLKMGGVEINSKWLNKGTSDKAIRAEAELKLATFTGDYSAILNLSEDETERSMLLSEYSRTKSLQETLRSFERMRQAKEQARHEAFKRRQAEAERVQEEKEAAGGQTQTIGAPLPPLYPEEKEQVKEYTFTFRATHASQEEWKGLIAYMKAHGFKYEQI